ncbi:hypothetical protein [Roseobacter sinensis]|uniref:Uncharacterized protein n=1 Tax=Roseobacter sinensis TaxID=2931391 RepID=A0ABT3BDM7_9RHOB|nr:hypothetical protein [Roseobacter sp. WL0113]MCV3271244.1 hypothetical protein [Roseobacter sp. WL0113]
MSAAPGPNLVPILSALNDAVTDGAGPPASIAGRAVLGNAGFGPIGPIRAVIVLLTIGSLPLTRPSYGGAAASTLRLLLSVC